jgi:hypothetical protein
MPRAIAVTLISAAEHQAVLAGLIKRLDAGGERVHLIVEGEQELDRLIARVEAVGERGLFVRCEGEVADELLLRRLEATLARFGGPGHKLIRLDLLGRSPTVLATRIERECEALAKLELEPGRKPPPSALAPGTGQHAAISVPAIRLEPGEQLDGDTLRIDLPDTPKLAELARRRKALRGRGQGPAEPRRREGHADDVDLPAHASGSSVAQRAPTLDARTLGLLLAAALLAVLLALIVSGTIG